MPDRAISLEGQPALDPEVAYGSHYFRHGCGVPYERNEHWLGFFGKVADGIVRDFHPASVLDAGCAMGFLVEALEQRGVEAWGIDSSEYAISEADESIRDHVRVASLTEPLERRYDLIACIETIEHLPAAEAGAALANLCGATDRLLLSTTPSDYGEATHLNVQPPEAWSALLAQQGFLRDLDHDLSYLTPWAALYTRAAQPLEETVRSYDRAWWRLRHETSELRAALLAAQERLAALEGGSGDTRSELQHQLEASNEEVLRLRDLLIGKDAELGAAKGQLSALEGHAHLLISTAQRLQARVPGAMRIAGAGLRRLQGRRGRPGA